MSEQYDFSGLATRYGVKCADGRTILPNAFKDDDGITVPLVWNHQHDGPYTILGNAKLVHCDEGVKAYCSFNDTEAGEAAKKIVHHGDIKSLSIYANNLKEKAKNVMHGAIKEVSLVLAGANKGAFIDPDSFAHSEDGEEEIESAYIWTGEFGIDCLTHSDEDGAVADNPEENTNEENKENEEGTLEHSEEPKKSEEDKNMAEEKTVQEVFESVEKKVTPEEMDVIYGVIGQAAQSKPEDDDDDDKEEKDMKHNLFDQEEQQETNFLCHSDEGEIIGLAKKSGSFKDALNYYMEENNKTLAHSDPTWGPATVGGFDQNTAHSGNVTWLFPDYKDLKSGAPELITDDQSWQEKVISKTHKLPFSRVRTGQVDIRNIDALRAKGYPQKGAYKKYSGNFNLVRRTTDPQTVYVKNALHRDDIIDITDFDYVQYLYNIDQMMLKDELATAILFGDGREISDEDKISEDHIRPIWTDDDLYTMKGVLDLDAAKSKIQGSDTSKRFSENYILAEAFIEKLLYMREKFKGTGSPDLYIDPHMVNVMLLSRDLNGRRIYNSLEELRSALNVNSIITVEQMANKTRSVSVTVEGVTTTETHKLLALCVNLQDYAIGSTKGGEITHFTQFDIDFNQEKSLIETRVSGALTKVWSAMAIEEIVAEG